MQVPIRMVNYYLNIVKVLFGYLMKYFYDIKK